MKIRRNKKLKGNRSTAGNIFIFLLLGFFACFMIIPLLYAVVSAFKPMDEIFAFPPKFFVRRPVPDNFIVLYKLAGGLWVPLSRYIFNSLFVCLAATVGHVIIASAAAYPLAKHKLRINWIFGVIVAALLFDGTVIAIPRFILMAKLSLLNQYWTYILPVLPASLGLFLMKQFMEGIPDSLIEASIIDGASQYLVFWRIIMPNVKPAWITLTIFTFQSVWNTGASGLVYREELKMLSDAVNQVASGGITRTGASMAGSLILMLPPILIFVFAQNKVIETMAYSGIKE